MPGQLTFFILGGVAILSSMLVISRRNAIYSALWFILTLFAASGIFLQLRAPLSLAAQFEAVACVLIGIVLFAVEVSKLDLTLGTERNWMPKGAAIIAIVSLAIQFALVMLQHRFLTGENVVLLLPRAPVSWPPLASEVIRFFFSYHLLPLALILLLLLIAGVGIGAVFQKRA
jgi:NADH-quinone oxidoreductase subunit J